MSDARWIEIDEDIGAAVKHFQNAVDLHAEGGFMKNSFFIVLCAHSSPSIFHT